MANPIIITRGRNITNLQQSLSKKIDPADLTRLMQKAELLVRQLPDVQGNTSNRQGLLLGLIQSGKTGALTTSIAMAADNGYTCFIVLTSDNIWLYNQTVERIEEDLQMLEVAEKNRWVQAEMFMPIGLTSTDNKGLIIVATKNTTVLGKLSRLLSRLKVNCGGKLPVALIFDDEADQGSLDTQTSRRAKNPAISAGRINTLISEIRAQFESHAFIQVTATPQALFLQEENNLYRPEFTILLEPGKGYTGGSTFFSLIEEENQSLLRPIIQEELDTFLQLRKEDIDNNINAIPQSLRTALCMFYVGASLKYRQKYKELEITSSYSFLCHISEKMDDHALAFAVISQYYVYLRNGLSNSSSANMRLAVEKELRQAYDEIVTTFKAITDDPSEYTFEKILSDIEEFISGTDIQTINSGAEQDRPRYTRRYNILIGGTKLSRGVTIDGLIVTYYGRQARRPNIDTMLQHARMYGYRAADLDVTRLFVTANVEARFRLINESEDALREVIEKYPGREYRGIRIGQNLNATRKNIYNPNNVGAYAAGSAYSPRRPKYLRQDVEKRTQQLDRMIATFCPEGNEDIVYITIRQLITLIKMTSSEPKAEGLWDDKRIIAAIETLSSDTALVGDRAGLIVRRNRELNPHGKGGYIRSVLGGTTRRMPRGDISLADPSVFTLFMYRLRGDTPTQPGKPRWDEVPFWVPTVRFPDGEYALMFNFE